VQRGGWIGRLVASAAERGGVVYSYTPLKTGLSAAVLDCQSVWARVTMALVSIERFVRSQSCGVVRDFGAILVLR
jgi:hypothetical protein